MIKMFSGKKNFQISAVSMGVCAYMDASATWVAENLLFIIFWLSLQEKSHNFANVYFRDLMTGELLHG